MSIFSHLFILYIPWDNNIKECVTITSPPSPAKVIFFQIALIISSTSLFNFLPDNIMCFCTKNAQRVDDLLKLRL